MNQMHVYFFHNFYWENKITLSRDFIFYTKKDKKVGFSTYSNLL